MPTKSEEKLVMQWLTGCVKLKCKQDIRAAVQKDEKLEIVS